MKLSLPKHVTDALPAPGEDGIIRANVGLKMSGEGDVELVEVNDEPVPTTEEETEEAAAPPEPPFEQQAAGYEQDMGAQLGAI